LPRGYLATSVDQLVTLLFAKYARELAKTLPSDQANHLPDSEVGWHFETEPSVGCPSTKIVYVARKALMTSVEIDCSNTLAGL
jgi:hypothetical protein